MVLSKYGILFKIYLKEYYSIKYSELTITYTLMNYIYEKELIKYTNNTKKQLKDFCPEAKTNEFVVMTIYNNMI